MKKQKFYFKKNVHYLCKIHRIKINELLQSLKLPKNYVTTYGLVVISDYFNVEADSLLFDNYDN